MQYIHSGETEKKVRINIGSGTKVERKNLDEMDDIVTAEKKEKKKEEINDASNKGMMVKIMKGRKVVKGEKTLGQKRRPSYLIM